MTAFSEWQNFYVIVGSSAGALIGLQFVVIALVAGLPQMAKPGSDAQAFATPTIVQFAAILLVAGVMSAPWHGVRSPAVVLGAIALAGLLYAISITVRLRRQTAYKPQFEDWLCHAALPIAAFALMLGASGALQVQPRGGQFAVAASTLLLLFNAIHNAWDTAAWHVFVTLPRRAARKAEEEKVDRGA